MSVFVCHDVCAFMCAGFIVRVRVCAFNLYVCTSFPPILIKNGTVTVLERDIKTVIVFDVGQFLSNQVETFVRFVVYVDVLLRAPIAFSNFNVYFKGNNNHKENSSSATPPRCELGVSYMVK